MTGRQQAGTKPGSKLELTEHADENPTALLQGVRFPKGRSGLMVLQSSDSKKLGYLLGYPLRHRGVESQKLGASMQPPSLCLVAWSEGIASNRLSQPQLLLGCIEGCDEKGASPFARLSRRALRTGQKRQAPSIDRSDGLPCVGRVAGRIESEISPVSLAVDDQKRESRARLPMTIQLPGQMTRPAIAGLHAALNLTGWSHSALLVRHIGHEEDDIGVSSR